MTRVIYTNAIHLQGIGLAHALPADQLRVGDVTLWNFGGDATIKAITPKATTQLVMSMESTPRGRQPETHDRTLKRSRLVGVTRATWIAHGRDPQEPPKIDTSALAKRIYS